MKIFLRFICRVISEGLLIINFWPIPIPHLKPVPIASFSLLYNKVHNRILVGVLKILYFLAIVSSTQNFQHLASPWEILNRYLLMSNKLARECLKISVVSADYIPVPILQKCPIRPIPIHRYISLHQQGLLKELLMFKIEKT